MSALSVQHETRHIPLSDLVAQYRSLQPEVDAAISAVLTAGEFERGEELRLFEREFARFCAVRYAVAVGSGYAALFLALRALDIGPDDEVITVPNTDIATCSAISHCGARVVWADVREDTFNIDPEQVATLIGPRTRAIVAVHLYGLPADLTRLQELADPLGIAVIEDAALACGATLDGRRVGGIGRVGCFSFAPHKVLGAYGDGGMITTNDPALARTARLLAGYGEPSPHSMAGSDGRFSLVAEGYHSHLDLLQAAILRIKLRQLDSWIAARVSRARLYDELLTGSPVVTPVVPAGAGHVYRTYVVRVPRRDDVRSYLAARGIATGLHYVPPLHLQPIYRDRGLGPGAFPVAERVSEELMCLPLYPELSEEAVRRVAAELIHAVTEL